MQLDYIQGMGARCAGSDPDIVALAQVAKRLKRVYFTGRYGRHQACLLACAIHSEHRPCSDVGFGGSSSVVRQSRNVPGDNVGEALTDDVVAFRGPSMLFRPPGLGSIKVQLLRAS